MTFLNGIILLLIFQLIGEVGVHTLSLPVLGPVLGMFLLFVFFLLRRGLPDALDIASTVSVWQATPSAMPKPSGCSPSNLG